jgi:6-phosphogluconolactonase
MARMKKSSADIARCLDLADVSQQAAEEFVRLSNEATGSGGRFTVALSGGSTPKALYSLLATDTFRVRIPWEKVHLFWGDERCVSS